LTNKHVSSQTYVILNAESNGATYNTIGLTVEKLRVRYSPV
jgi:hypothetical protein